MLGSSAAGVIPQVFSQHSEASMQFRKPETIPLLFIIGAVALLGSLGFWQLERLEWKNGLIAASEAAQNLPVLTHLPKDITGLTYRNVRFSGGFHHKKALHMMICPQQSG